LGILETTYGHDFVRASLLQALARGALPSQLLLVGPEGIGKKRMAWGLVEVLLCENRSSPHRLPLSACGRCASCSKINSGFHENVLFLEPEKNLIKLEKAKEVQDFLSLAHDGEARVVIVDDAHCFNPQASNALLKLVEEPPPRTYFFFITHRWAQVLPTIRSRATKIPFRSLSDQELARWGDGNKDAELIRLARGSVKALLEQKQEGATQIRNEAYDIFRQFFSDPRYLVLGSWRDLVKDKDKLILFIRYWLMSLHDYLTQKNKQEGKNDSLSLPPHWCGLPHYGDEELWTLWEGGLSLESGVLGHRDPVLLIEEWFMKHKNWKQLPSKHMENKFL